MHWPPLKRTTPLAVKRKEKEEQSAHKMDLFHRLFEGWIPHEVERGYEITVDEDGSDSENEIPNNVNYGFIHALFEVCRDLYNARTPGFHALITRIIGILHQSAGLYEAVANEHEYNRAYFLKRLVYHLGKLGPNGGPWIRKGGVLRTATTTYSSSSEP